MKRKIYEKLVEWKNTDMTKPLMIIGARQIGKTYIIDEFCKKEFKNYIYINLFEQAEIVKIFKLEISTAEKFRRMQIYLDTEIDIENTIIFFDEIQESEELISTLKYFNESEQPFKIICAGSLLGVKLKRMHSSFPVGKVKMLNMYPMDFEEFLMANGNLALIDEIRNCYNNLTPMDTVLHNKILELYKLYLCVGGIEDIYQSYLSDVGILLNMLKVKYNDVILDNLLQYKGIIAENYVATQLVANNIPLIYWESGNKAEVDFILYNDNGIIPIEVKANDNVSSQSLNIYIKRYNPKYAIRISTKNFGYSNNIKSIPLYATFLIK